MLTGSCAIQQHGVQPTEAGLLTQLGQEELDAMLLEEQKQSAAKGPAPQF